MKRASPGIEQSVPYAALIEHVAAHDKEFAFELAVMGDEWIRQQYPQKRLMVRYMANNDIPIVPDRLIAKHTP